MSRTPKTGGVVQLLSTLVHVQAHLEGDLSLAALARHAGLSPFQLARRFTAAVGETPKHTSSGCGSSGARSA
jgi:transcriptional regulator GlxA family with amidase domain